MKLSKKTLAMLAGILIASSVKTSAKPWTNVQPAYNTKTAAPTIRIEAGNRLSEKLNSYVMCDFDGRKNDKTAFDYFGGFNLSYDLKNKGLGNKINLEAEYRGNQYTDMERLGISKSFKIGNSQNTLIYFAFGKGDINGGTFKSYSTQQINDVTASLMTRYNPKSKEFCFEPEVDKKFGKKYNKTVLFIQGRGSGKLEDAIKDMQLVAGIKYTF